MSKLDVIAEGFFSTLIVALMLIVPILLYLFASGVYRTGF